MNGRPSQLFHQKVALNRSRLKLTNLLDVQILLDILSDEIEKSDGNIDIFLEPVAYNLYPTYLLLVAYPLDISLLQKRLESNYYRQKEVLCLVSDSSIDLLSVLAFSLGMGPNVSECFSIQ